MGLPSTLAQPITIGYSRPMTRKHFEAIAADIKFQMEQSNDEGKAAIRSTAAALSVTFSIFNSNFDRRRFLTACGIEG